MSRSAPEGSAGQAGYAATYLLHYSEVALKGKNRPQFVRVLRRNVKRAMGGEGACTVEHREGRLLLRTSLDRSSVEKRLSRVFGVAWFAETAVVRPLFRDIADQVVATARLGKGTFRITARRTDRAFPIGSMDMERKLGAEVVESTGRRVDLSGPEETIHSDVLKDRAFVYSDRASGLGGLPVGSAGRVLHLFSGGIDSPVAAWLLMKRGCTPVYLHFYLAPTPQYALESKVMGLVKVLAEYSGKTTLLLIPFADYQLATAEAPGDLEPSLFRRFMRVAAESLATRFGAEAISTGDSLSQAASQTLSNTAVFDSGSSLPVLRPLLTYDKEEVISLARRIGTYELSLQEYKDCCAIITRHPRTRVKGEAIDFYADRLGFRALAESSIRAGTLVTFNPATGEARSSSLADVGGNAPRGSSARSGLRAEAKL